MKIKIILILSISFFINIAQSKIIYEDGNEIITTYDLEVYQSNFEIIYNSEIQKTSAIKNIVLMNSVVNFLKKQDIQMIEKIDKAILANNRDFNSDNPITLNMLRLLYIRNNFVYNYYDKELTKDEVHKAINLIDNFKVELSSNNCLTISDYINSKNNFDFSTIIFQMIKNKKNGKLTIKINSIEYQVCIKKSLLNRIEFSLFNMIENKTNKDFNAYLYDSIKR